MPTVVDDAIANAIASLNSSPSIPIASSAMQQPEVSMLLKNLSKEAQDNLNHHLFQQVIDPIHQVAIITVNPVHDHQQEKADFNLPLGSFLTLNSPDKVNVTLDADYVLVLRINLATNDATVMDGNVSDALFQVTHTPNNLPASTMAIHAVATLPPQFTALGYANNLFASLTGVADTRFDGMFAINTGSFDVGLVSKDAMGNYLVPDSLPPGVAFPAPDVKLTSQTAHADFNVQMDTDIGPGVPFVFGLTANLSGDWKFTNAQVAPKADSPFGTQSDLEVKDLTIDVGSLTTFVRNFVQEIQSVTAAPGIKPIVDLFGSKLPLVNESLGDLAADLHLLPGGIADAIDAIKVINGLQITPQTGQEALGSFFLSDPRDQANFHITAFGTNTPTADAPQLIADLNNILGTAFGQGNDPTIGLHFPLLADPAGTLDQLLLGKNVTLATFKSPAIDFNFSPPLAGQYAGLGVGLSGSIHFHLQVSMGYDAAGLQLYRKDKNKDSSDFKHGFYFDAANTRADITGGLTLTGGAGVMVSGGLFADVAIRPGGVPDPSAPNKRRLDALLDDGDCMFDQSGKVYIKGSISFGVGPFSTPPIDFAYHELASFRNDCNALASSLPLTIVTNTTDHILLLQTTRMKAGDAIHVKPFVNKSLTDDDPLLYSGIEVDYADATFVYVETRDGVVINHYDTIGLDGALPATNIDIEFKDPFSVFASMQLPYPTSATPRVVMVGGSGDDTLEYLDFGTKAQVLLIGGGGNNVLLGGSLTIANYVTSPWTGPVAGFLPPINSSDSTADQYAENLLAGEIQAVTDLSASKPGGYEILIATRDSTLVGGAGTNQFETLGAGNINTWGGAGANTFRVSPSTNGVRNSYLVHGGGPGSSNTLLIEQGDDPTVKDAELDVNLFASDITDDTNPSAKALAVSDAKGTFALVHGVEGFSVLADSGTIPTVIGVGDLSDTAVTKSAVDTHRVRDRTAPITQKYLGSAGGDTFTLTADAVKAGDQRPPTLTLTTHYGSTGKTTTTRMPAPLTIDTVALDGGEGSDTYNLNLGVGTNFPIGVNDSSSATPNTLNINGFTAPTGFYLRLDTLTVNDGSIEADFHTPHFGPDLASVVHGPLTPVFYALKTTFNANVSQVNVNSAGAFRDVIVDRPTAQQEVDLNIGYASEQWAEAALGLAADGSPDEKLDEGGNAYTTYVDQVNSFAVLSNAGTLRITTPVHYPFAIQGNTGDLTLDTTGSNVGPIAGGIAISPGAFYFYAFTTKGTDSMTIGNNGSLANVKGTIHVRGGKSQLGMVLDDSNDPAGAQMWDLDASGIQEAGGLTLDYAATSPGGLTFSSIRLATSPNSTAHPSDFYRFGPLFYRVTSLEIDSSGAGSTLQGPDATNSWNISGTDSGTLNGFVAWTGFQNLTGGSAGDSFAFHNTSHVSGAIDGGGGFDVLDYTAYSAPFVANLATNTAPLIAGSVSNVEAITPDPLSLSAPSQSVTEGKAVSIQVTASSSFHLSVAVSVTGLPAWLSYNPATGLISGVAPTGSTASSPYTLLVGASDSIGNTRSVTVEVFVTSVPIVIPLTGAERAVIRTQFQAPLAIEVTDPTGKPIASVPVTFQVLTGATGASAAFGSPQGPPITGGVTGPTGIVVTPPLFANGNVGTFVVVAIVQGGGGVNFPLANIASLTADSAPPTTHINNHPLALDADSAGSFTFSGSDDVTASTALTFQVNLDNTGWHAIAGSSFSYQGLADGAHVFQVRAVDAAGNVDPNPPSYSWTIDATPPTLTLPADQDVAATGPAGAVVDFSAVAADLHGPVSIAYSAAPGSLFALGTTSVTLTATDALGNRSTGSFNVVVEDAAPIVSIGGAPKALTNAQSADFELNVSDAVTSPTALVVETNLDGLGWVPVTGNTQHFDNLAEGPHTFQLRATNSAGKVSAIAQTSWTIDATPPDLTIPPDQIIEATDATGAIVSYPEAAATDPDDVVSLTYSQSADTLFPLGTTSVSVTAADGLGNSITKSFEVVVRDTTPPDVSIKHEPNALTGSPDAPFEFVATDTVTATASLLLEAKLDSQNWQPIGGTTLDLAGLSDGGHSLLVRATDAAGNTSVPVAFDWTIDSTPPTLTVPADLIVEATGPNGATVAYDTPSASDDSGSVQVFVSRDSGTIFPMGKTVVTVTAIDAAGNYTIETLAVVVHDSTAPAISFTHTPDAFTGSNDAPFAFSASDIVTPTANLVVETNLDGQGWQAVNGLATDFPDLAPGQHTVQARATDEAGNVSPIISVTWRIDAAPVVDGVTIAPANPRTNDLLTANVSSHDADGDALSFQYQWYRNNVALAGATGTTLDLSHAGNGDSGDAIKVQVIASDGTLQSNPATSAVVTVANTPPDANNASLNTTDGTAVAGTLSASDPDASSLTYSVITGPGHGNVSLNPSTGAFTYTPISGFTGTDTFTFKASDGQDDSAPATVTVVVAPGSKPPTLTLGAIQLTETEFTFQSSVSNGSGPFTYSVVAAPSGATINASTGIFHWTPGAGQLGAFAVQVKVTDSAGRTDQQVVVLTTLGVVGHDLVVVGTSGPDTISFSRTSKGAIAVSLGSTVVGTFSDPITRIVASGLGGDDTLKVDPHVGVSGWLYGGAGSDVLVGGSGADVLLGGSGNDVLYAGSGRDLLIGGEGTDVILGGGDQDILIAGTTTYDANPQALQAIMAEWTSSLSIAKRIAHIQGATTGSMAASS